MPVTIIVITVPKEEIAGAIIISKNGILFMFFLKQMLKVKKKVNKKNLIKN